MRKWLVVAPVLAVAAVAAHAAELEISHCEFPEAPAVPDGTQASESEMGKAGADVREFVAGIQSSLECLAEVEESMGEEITEEQQAELVAVYNTGVDQMNTIAEQYNEQVRAFKEQ